MKTFGSIIKTLTIFLFWGMLFFSCSLSDNGDYGTLVIKLPGSGSARAAISPEFTATLSYSVDCIGPDKKSQKFKSGESASMRLLPGEWKVTVTVFNAADENIGEGEPESVVIEAGKTTTVPMPVKIETHHNRVTDFAITGFLNSVRSEINDKDGEEEDFGIIIVYVSVPPFKPTGDERVTINFTHTGKSANPPSGSLLSSMEDDLIVMVTAENGRKRTYSVQPEVVGMLLPTSLTITGLPSNVETVIVYVFEQNTIDTILDFEDNYLAGGISENAKNFFLIDVKSPYFDGDEFNPMDYPNPQDMQWKGKGMFDVIAMVIDNNYNYEYKKAQVLFDGGIGSVDWKSFTSIMDLGGFNWNDL